MDIKKDNAMYMQIAQIAANRSYATTLKSRLRHCQKQLHHQLRMERHAYGI